MAANDHFGDIVDAIGVGVGVYGADGRYVYVNPTYADLLGTDEVVLEGVAIWEVNPAFERSRFDEYWDSFEPGESRTAETRHVFEGTAIDVNVRTTCCEIDGERYHVGTILDIGERRRRQQELEYQRSLLKAQQEVTIDGILIVDEDDEIVSYNRRFAEIWDVPEDLIEAGDDEPVLEHVVGQVRNPEEFLERVEYLYDHREEDSRDQIEHVDGRVFDRYTTAVVDEDTYYGRLWVFRDVTENVERQRALERQNRRLDQFASIVSHDLRNPLNVAEGRIRMVAEDCDSDHLDAVRQALERMGTLIDDMLTLAREGQSVDEMSPVGVAETAERAWQNVETGDATLRVDADFAVLADENRCTQMFENLFRNAIEHAGPSVTVDVGTLPTGFYVEDDGPGIPPDDREAVLEIGYSTTDGGTGFGLSIVREIVEAHGWRIDVTEGSSGGARFDVTDVERTRG